MGAVDMVAATGVGMAVAVAVSVVVVATVGKQKFGLTGH
jgi:hypothetical protein